jgi:hypothetical protein
MLVNSKLEDLQIVRQKATCDSQSLKDSALPGGDLPLSTINCELLIINCLINESVTRRALPGRTRANDPDFAAARASIWAVRKQRDASK